MVLWIVLGGADSGGLKVRVGQELSSVAYEEKLSHGAEAGRCGSEVRMNRPTGNNYFLKSGSVWKM